MNDALKAKLANLPKKPGVYMMKDKAGKIIYIGKAKILKNRVSSYFHSRAGHDPKTAILVSKIHDVDLLVTDSEIEALILEANLVKEHKPRYNVSLKDDKRYPYIRFTLNEPFPRLMVVRRVANDGARYFGPYTNVTGMRRTLRFLMRHFKIRSCNYEIPSSTGRKYKVCLDYHIGRCNGPCEDLESREEYARHVESVILFLSGRRTDLVNRLKDQMAAASDDLRFEDAARLRDTIEAMESVHEKQKVDSADSVDRDVVAYARQHGDASTIVMQIREGILIGRQDFQLHIDPRIGDSDLLSGFIKQYYNHQENVPAELYLSIAIDDAEVIEAWLSTERKAKVRVITPQKGVKFKLVAMAETNARLLLDEMLLQKLKIKQRIPAASTELRHLLQLERAPLSVSCFDISNLGESDKVASLVYFEKGKPKKSEYRHFKIKTVAGQDDFASMKEVIGRYVSRRKEEEKPLPDLMMVDGGKGQLTMAVDILAEAGLDDQPIIGLAKRLEEVFVPGQSEPVHIPRDSAAINLLKKVRDEAHRFAITYHRKLRSKRTIASELDGIPGVGEARRTALLTHFGSVKKVREASAAELAEVNGIPVKLADVIYKHFHEVKE